MRPRRRPCTRGSQTTAWIGKFRVVVFMNGSVDLVTYVGNANLSRPLVNIVNGSGMRRCHTTPGREMAEGFWIAILIVALVVAYALSRVVSYSRKSERQWRQVDKSKLKSWDEDEG